MLQVKIKLNEIKKNKGILFWITGLSGSGKTTIAEKIKRTLLNKYGPTVIVSGDNLRKMFNFRGQNRTCNQKVYKLIKSLY